MQMMLTIKKGIQYSLQKNTIRDINPGDKEAEAKFKEASEAYAVLSDAQKREDSMTSLVMQPLKVEQAAAGAGGFDFGDMGDIFGDIFGGGDIFGDLFGRRKKT